MNVLHIRQDDPVDDLYPIRLTLRRDGQAPVEAEAKIEFTFTDQEHEDLRWYLEDYLQRANTTEPVVVEQVEALMKSRGEELYAKVLAANQRTQAIWFPIRNELADLRIEIASGIAEAASIPWELMRDPETDAPLSLRVKSFVRVQSDPNISFVSVPPPAKDGRIRLLYIACRPGGANDVELRAVANRLLQDLRQDRARFDFKALRPPTFEQLQKELTDAKEAGRPYHIVHFDGHGVYADLSKSKLSDWAGSLSPVDLGGAKTGKHGYVIFEHPSEKKMRPVDGHKLGQLLHDNGVPVLVLNACQSAMHEAITAPAVDKGVHDEVRAIGSLSQAVINEGIPAVLGMRYSVYVVTAAQYIGELYAALAKGRGFGQAATEGRKHLYLNPDRWIGLQPRPLQDWFVPVAFEATTLQLLPPDRAPLLAGPPETDPVQKDVSLLRHVPDEGFIGRDETLFALDRAFDNHRIVLLHAYAGQGKSATAVEFARWYSMTGGLGEHPMVLLASFEGHTDVDDLFNQIGQVFAPVLEAQGVMWSAVNNRERRRQLVLEILRYFPILWIWDNVEPVAGFPEGAESQWTKDEQKDLRDFLQQLKLDTASKVRILLTSRRDEKKWLGAIPHRIPMPRMRNSDAARLAFKLGQEKRVNPLHISDWQPLLDYCDGNPLTLQVLVGQAVSLGLTDRQQIARFVEAIRSGEQAIDDIDAAEGREKSLGASLQYGFSKAFDENELAIIALLHLFQRVVHVPILGSMGHAGDYSLPELQGKSDGELSKLLHRAKEIGLLTHMHSTSFSIHPALPWFLRQIFVQHYDGESGRSSQQAALRSWIEVFSSVAVSCHQQINNGNTSLINLLQLEEANLLHARRLARRASLWSHVIFCMQGMRSLYQYQGRQAEWARLVEEIRSDYCTDDDEPIKGREADAYLVMEYRVRLALQYERDHAKAISIQKKLVESHRALAAQAIAQPPDVQLDNLQRHQLRSLAVSLEALGNILKEADDPACVQSYIEGINICKRVEDKLEETIIEFNLGQAYLSVSAIRDLNHAEAGLKRSLELSEANNISFGRYRCRFELGMVEYERFEQAADRKESNEVQIHHLNEAAQYCIDALRLCPKDNLPDLAPMHQQLGLLQRTMGNYQEALEQYERAIECCDGIGDRFNAGSSRFGMALTYSDIARREKLSSLQRSHLLRARAYGQAALRDYQHYGGRAADSEHEVESFLRQIDEHLRIVPS